MSERICATARGAGIYACCIAVLLVSQPDAGTVTVASMLRSMPDLASLTRLPDPSYTTRMFSSYDGCPKQLTLQDPQWWHNRDRGRFLDTLASGEVVLFDAHGPGAIVRIWSANPVYDSLRFYFDDDTSPSWSVPMNALLGGTWSINAPFAGVRAQGYNLYFPITYSGRCKITLPRFADIYYHITYRTYAPSVTALTFEPAVLHTLAPLIDSIAEKLSQPGAPIHAPAFTDMAILLPDSHWTTRLNGPNGAITGMSFRVRTSQLARFLRATVLTMRFDSATNAQVETPLGDMFGFPEQVRAYSSLPISATTDTTLVSHWVMPFRNDAVVRLINTGVDTGYVDISIAQDPYRWDSTSQHFHAYWRQDTGQYTAALAPGGWYMVQPPRDHRFIDIRGVGTYVGTVLQVWNRESQWWGEGDEKIFIDDTISPALFGTGTEDYFGYAWSNMSVFSHAYHAQPYSQGFHGFTTCLRWHILDAMPFTSRLIFDMEIQTAFNPTHVDFGRCAVFYARPVAQTDHTALGAEDLYIRELPSTYRSVHVAAASTASGRFNHQFDFRGRVVSPNAPLSRQVLIIVAPGMSTRSIIR